MSLLDKCKAILTDPHPERDETHSATRYALDRAHCPAQPCPGANPALCGVCTDTRKPLSVAKPLYERELPLVDTPAQDTLEQKAANYIKYNPVAVKSLKDLALWDVRHGKHRGMKAIVEEYRYSVGEDKSDSKYKWNNNYTSFVARYLMNTCDELRGHFSTRELAKSKTRRIPARAH